MSDGGAAIGWGGSDLLVIRVAGGGDEFQVRRQSGPAITLTEAELRWLCSVGGPAALPPLATPAQAAERRVPQAPAPRSRPAGT